MSKKRKRLLLEVRGSDRAPTELPSTGMMVVGSSQEKAGLCLQGQGVADVHCAIGKTKGGGFAIKDLGSEYGTLVNGTKVAQSRLGLGDEILVGSIRLRVIAAETPSEAGQSAPSSAPRAQTNTPAPLTSGSRERAPRKRSGPRLPQISGYKISERLGRGAMGDVYLAVQESLDREVALKVLSEKHEQDQAFVQSFQAEARAAAALNHPNIVTVHDVGEQGGVHYLTMEYMDRGSLEERVAKEGALPWPLVLDAIKDAASGLVYAESRGIVHRDIKPANLMQNHTGVTKIADLGLATSIGSEDAGDGLRKIFGTPHFISPEQVKGEKADCRSDLYSLGSTAYRLLSGHTPFEGGSTREILRDKLKGNPKPVQEFAPDVPPGLAKIVARLIELQPEDRYPSATALLREIEALRSGASEAPVPAGAGGPKTVKLLVGAALVAVIGFGALSIFGGGAGKRDAGTPGPPPGPRNGDVVTNAEPLDNDPEPLPLGTVTSAPRDDDIQEKLFETAAENALLRLAQRDLAPAERRDALRELAREYLGTTAAATAVEEAARLDKQIASAARQETARNSQVEAQLQLLVEAAGLQDPALRPGNALRAIRLIEGQEALAQDDMFVLERAKLEAQVIATALQQFALVEAEIAARHVAGDFEAMGQLLRDLIGRCDLPAFEEGQAPPRAQEIEALRFRLADQLDSLERLEVEYKLEQSRADKRAIGTGLGGLGGLGAELARLDLEAALARVEALGATLDSGSARAWNDALAVRLRSASRALPMLVAEFADWRRLKVDDPEDRRGATREAVTATAQGLVLDDKGTRREVPWSAFGGQTKPLGTLFSKRLNRDYTPAELRSIAALMHVTALAEVLLQASEMFAPAAQSVFTQSEADELPLCFDRALEWCQDDVDRELLQRDRAAAAILANALLKSSEGAWTTAVSEVERLLRDHYDTWLVRILSDGRTVDLPR